jgi:peptidoglycan-associated lipoprotein
MVDRLNAALCLSMFFSFLLLTGCAPSATRKPEAVSPAPQTDAGKGKSDKTAPAPESPTSLEALRRGEAPTLGPLKEIYFDFDKYDLRPDARETLKANAEWLRANASSQVEIEGHTDERGTNEYNLALGAKRAQAAKDYLVSLGTTAERLSTISYGEEVPVCKEPTEECWQRNRRARFVITTPRPAS